MNTRSHQINIILLPLQKQLVLRSLLYLKGVGHSSKRGRSDRAPADGASVHAIEVAGWIIADRGSSTIVCALTRSSAPKERL